MIRWLLPGLRIPAAVALLACAILNGGAVLAAPRSELRVAAAADLAKALPRIAIAFEKRTGVHVVPILGSTGLLTKQAENGAPFDLLLAADERHVVELENGGKILTGSRRVYAIGKLVLWSCRVEGAPRALQDLARADIRRVAIANPEHAPYGAAAIDALRAAGVWDAVRPKLVYGENVQQVLRYARSGAADAALVSRSLVIGIGGVASQVPQALYAPIRQALCVLRATRNPQAARQFAAFLLRAESRAILQQFGFTLPPQKAR